jgi:hypothetical protein
MLEYAVVELHKDRVDRRSLTPREDFVAEVAERLTIRRRDEEALPIIKIPNTKDILGPRSRSIKFQFKLMEAVNEYLGETRPSALFRQKYGTLNMENPPGHRATRRYIEQYSFSARVTRTDLHTDYLERIFISLCYSATRNIHGGTLLFVDLLKMGDELGCKIYDIVKPFRMDLIDEESGPSDFSNSIHPLLHEKIKPYTHRIEDLDFAKHPIVMFSNRLEDGLAHGATKVTKHDISFGTHARNISYAAIAYYPPGEETIEPSIIRKLVS